MVGQVIVTGLSMGVIYALIAMGFSLVYRMTRVINFAHGDLVMLGGLVGFSVYTQLNWGFLAAIVISSLFVGLMMVVVDRLALARAYRKSVIAAVVSSIGLSFVLQNIAQLIWGKGGFSFPTVFGSQPVPVLGVLVVPELFVICIIGTFVMIGLTLFMTRSRLGVAMRAAAGDSSMALLVGVDVQRINSLSFFIAGALGAIAGVLLAPITFLTATMGTALGLKGFVAALIGGLGSLPGAAIGGLALGLLETSVGAFVDARYREGIVYALMVAMLFIRPYGLFGEEGVDEGR